MNNFFQNQNGISNEELYKLMDNLSIEDSSALIAGVSPNRVSHSYYNDEEYIELNISKTDPENANEVFFVCLKTLTHAVKSGQIKAFIEVDTNTQSLVKSDLKKDWLLINEINTKKTIIKRDDLKEWLDKRGVYPPLLFPNGKKDDYMNPNHEHYSPELAICVRAWEVAQTAYIDNQTIKQFMEGWIKENAGNFILDSIGVKKAKELASISNWAGNEKIKGGVNSSTAPPSNSSSNDSNTFHTVHRKLEVDLPNQPPSPPVDDDIPF